MRKHLRLLTPLLAAGVWGCSEGTTGPVAEGTVVVRFAGPVGTEGGQSSDLVISGFNGTLTLTDVRLVVDVFDLKRENDISECSAVGNPDLCADLELGPAIVDLPLSAGVVTLGQAVVPGGEYEEIEFELADLQGDAGLLAEARALPGLAAWPEVASVAATGTFLDAQSGEVRPFTVFFDVDAEVELEFATNRLDVGEGDPGTITIHVDPREWLTLQGGVIDLSAFDYATTGQVASFDFSFQSGVQVSVED